MHAPDGFLNAGTAVATGAISAGTVGVALRQLRQRISERRVPLAGVAAAFVFAAQMFNFPVAAGTTGHLLGGALAAILLGPHLGAIAVTVVVVVQALVFADGGLTALGYNVLNMAIVPAYGGYGAFLLFRRLLPTSGSGVVAATGLAGLISVVLSAMAFSIEWLFGATAPVSFAQVFAGMVGVHFVVGLGEAVISAMAMSAVLVTRPDVVAGAADLEGARIGRARKLPIRTFIIGGLLVALFLGTVVSQFAFDSPDGLETVAIEAGLAEDAQRHPLDSSIFADYATAGLGNRSLSLAVAGGTGVIIVLVVGWGLVSAVRDPRGDGTAT